MLLTPELAPEAAPDPTPPRHQECHRNEALQRVKTTDTPIVLTRCSAQEVCTVQGAVTVHDGCDIGQLRMQSCALSLGDSKVRSIVAHGTTLAIGRGNTIGSLTLTSARPGGAMARTRPPAHERRGLSGRAVHQTVELNAGSTLGHIDFDGQGLTLRLFGSAKYLGPLVTGLHIEVEPGPFSSKSPPAGTDPSSARPPATGGDPSP